jgi:flagellar motor switch protein FliM
MLLQQFMGEKFGRDNIWEGHLATELWHTGMEVRAVLDEQEVSLRKVLDLKVGDTLMLNVSADEPVTLKCGAISLTRARIGRMGHKVAVRVEEPLALSAKKSLATLE